MVGPTVARRCLFGQDHALTRKFLDEKKSEIYNDAKLRWNFDFKKERPLDGRFLWRRITPKNVIQLPDKDCTNSSDSDTESGLDSIHSTRDTVALDVPPPQTSETKVDSVSVKKGLKIIRPIPVKRKFDQTSQTTLPEFYQAKKSKKI